MGAPVDIRDLARKLAERAPALAAELLPGGTRDGPHWRCGSIYGEPGNSFVYTLRGQYQGWWKEFDGDGRGDSLDLVAVILCGGDKSAACKWARQWLGIDAVTPSTWQRASRPAPPPEPVGERHHEKAKRGAAQRLWLGGTPIDGSPANAYLAGRGIGLASLGRMPRALRYGARVWCEEVRMDLPAMLAAIVAPDGRHLATHRTWLECPPGIGWRKASLVAPKKVLASYAGGTINLWRGKSGKPLREAPDGDTVAIAEGIEDALTVALACPDWRVLAAVSVANLAAVTLPPSITDVVLVLQRDGENDNVRRARAKAERRFMEEGRSVKRALPPEGHKDFNDWLRATQPKGVGA